MTVLPPDTVVYGWHTGLLDAEPQVLNYAGPITDTTAWTLISDTVVVREGGQRFLSIGNFNRDANSDTLQFNPSAQQYIAAYYYIDDVSVIALDSVPNNVGYFEEESKGFLLYPNPTKGELTIEGSVAEGEIAMLEVFNLVGQVVLSMQLTNGEIHRVDVGGLVEGIYSVRVTINSKVQYTDKLSVLK